MASFQPHSTNTAEENAAIEQVLAELNMVLGDLIEGGVTVRGRPRSEMPLYDDTHHSFGYWHSKHRVIDFANSLIGHPIKLRKVLTHESLHVREGEMVNWHWSQLLPMLNPEPDGLFDTTINGTEEGYPARPTECNATWGSAAVFGFTQPFGYKYYMRRYQAADFPKVRGILLAQAPSQELNQCKQQVTSLQGSVATLSASVERLNGELVTAQQERDDALALVGRKNAAIDAARAIQ